MFRKLLEANGIKTTDEEFKEIMEMTTDDIKFNRISFRKYTNLAYVINIVIRSVAVYKKCI